MSSNAIKLKFPPSIKLSPVVNVSRLRPYHQPSPLQTITPPPPVEIEGELKYNVEQVLGSRLYCRKLQYLVKWEGYTTENNTLEPTSNITHAKDAVAEFHWLHSSAPQCIRSLSSLHFRPYINYTKTIAGISSKLNIP